MRRPEAPWGLWQAMPAGGQALREAHDGDSRWPGRGTSTLYTHLYR
jgi:hypothetical protein